MTFHEKLQELRKERGMSQEKLAGILNVSRQAISKWESGQSYPEMEKLIALSEIFGTTLDSLVKEGELQLDNQNTISEPFWISRRPNYEYKSKTMLMGVPLVHINLGRGLKQAKGVIAIGNTAIGLLSFGFVSVGMLSFGCLSLGLLLSIGVFSIGTISMGAIALGIFAIGAIAFGMFSIGACAIASHIAVGAYAKGHIAIGKIAVGVRTIIYNHSQYNLNVIKASEVRELINMEFPNMWDWIVRLMTVFFIH